MCLRANTHHIPMTQVMRESLSIKGSYEPSFKKSTSQRKSKNNNETNRKWDECKQTSDVVVKMGG